MRSFAKAHSDFAILLHLDEEQKVRGPDSSAL